jgi:hypothetical protein
MLDFDGWGGGALCHGHDQGWSVLGECGISDVQTGPLEVKGNADMSWALITPGTHDDRELIPIVNSFYGVNDIGPEFWVFMEKLQPYFFHRWRNDRLFVARDKTILDVLHSTEVLKQAEEYERQQQLKGRASIWETLGPECGPEKCVEVDCDRLRIPLAVRCLMHQRSTFR